MNICVEIEPKIKLKKKRRQSDDGLRPLFFKHLKHGCHWTAIETGTTTVEGVPDSEYCFEGGWQGWLEFKATEGWKPIIRPHQIAWIDKRVRLGGTVWIATRRRVKQVDDLYLTPGFHVKELAGQGFTDNVLHDSSCFVGGPRSWVWSNVRRILCS
jgi:hypothetical protein